MINRSEKLLPMRKRADACESEPYQPGVTHPEGNAPMHPDRSFVYHLHRPDDPDGSTLVLLHGTGGDETDLLPLGQEIAPRAVLLGVRGRSTEEGVSRWFRRLTATTFDQANIRTEVEAFAAFLPDALQSHELDPTRTVLVGFSNGANFTAAVMLLYPQLVRRAALLRAMLVLDSPPVPDLAGISVLAVAGRSDPYGRYASALNDILRRLGANLEARTVDAGHNLTIEDVAIVQEWIGRGLRFWSGRERT